jgi:hypothetical protein
MNSIKNVFERAIWGMLSVTPKGMDPRESPTAESVTEERTLVVDFKESDLFLPFLLMMDGIDVGVNTNNEQDNLYDNLIDSSGDYWE